MHLSYGRFGISPAALRLPAFLVGVLVAPTAYLAGAQLYGRHAALLAAGLTAVSAQLVEFSTNARGYSIAAFLGVALLALAPRVLRSTNLTWWALWGDRVRSASTPCRCSLLRMRSSRPASARGAARLRGRPEPASRS